jgi:hypothetical protein
MELSTRAETVEDLASVREHLKREAATTTA